jgi:hypothetical protein
MLGAGVTRPRHSAAQLAPIAAAPPRFLFNMLRLVFV